ncbi:MAG: glycosyltransferase, partial [Saprospiraceae bacterium]|nr:glycosyltransferase [Saprospiraceae bacterium]
MKVSIIIPVLNEAENITRLVNRLTNCGEQYVKDLLVVDGGSEDDTVALAEKAGAKVLVSPRKGRAAQMNYGAAHSQGDILYFVHGDTLPPECYMDEIIKAVEENYPIGCFRFKFDS